MSPIDDTALALIAEGILDASDVEVVRVCEAHGIAVDALVRKVRTMIAERAEAADQDRHAMFVVGETLSLRSDPARIGVVTAITPSNRQTATAFPSRVGWKVSMRASWYRPT